MSDSNLSRSQRAAKQQLENDVRAALQHAPTKRLLGRIFDMCGMYDHAGMDPQMIVMKAGRRSVGVELRMALDAADPYAYIAIQAEAVKTQQEAVAAAKAQRGATDADE